jgi:hypothetical protein
VRVLFLLAVILAIILWPPTPDTMPVSWPHEWDTPPMRLEDSGQWMCVDDGVLQTNGPSSVSYWCTDMGVEL